MKSTVAIVATLILTIAGLYIGIKHYKETGFWWGVLAILLIGSYISLGDGNTKVRIGPPENS